MPFLIESIATAVPSGRLRQCDILTDAVRFARADDREARALGALYRRSGIESRGSVLAPPSSAPPIAFYADGDGVDGKWPTTAARMEAYALHAIDLAARAAERALAEAMVEPAMVTRLVVVTCTGFSAPGVDIELIDRLGLSPRVKRALIGFMGCHAAINGLDVVSAMAATAAAGERALLVAVELCSLHAQAGMDPNDVVANALFADGAAAVVGRRTSRPAADDWALAATRSVHVPGSAEAMTWRIGDHGFRMSLSATIPDLLGRHLAAAVDGWLAESGLSRADIATWAVHPGGARILDGVESALSLDPDDLAVSRDVLREHGNMSSPTVLFVLEEARSRGARTPCVLLAFGPGLIVEMARIGGPFEPSAS